MDRRNRTGPIEREGFAGGHFSIGGDQRIIEWDEQAARLLGVPRDEALGRPCECVVGGKNDFGRAVCGPACPARKALDAGSIASTSRIIVRTVDGARFRLSCELTALPSGGALGRLYCADNAAPNLAYDLAGITALTTRVSSEPLQQGLRHALDFLLHATVADAGEAFLAEPHGKGVLRTCHRGCFARAFDQVLRFDPDQGFPGLVLSHGQPAYTDHLPEDQRFLRTKVKQEGFSTYVCTPLASRSDALGCLALAFRRSDVDLERVLNLLRWVSTPMGLVVETALAQLREVATITLHGAEENPEHRLTPALRALLQEMVRVSCADGGELYLPWHDVELRALVPVANAVTRCPALSEGMSGRCPAFKTDTISILQGHRKTWPLPCRDAAHPGGAWCCIPISCDGESLGMIRLLYRRLRPTPPNENIALIEGLASMAAKKVRDIRDRLAQGTYSSAGPNKQLQRDGHAPEILGDTASRPMRLAPPVYAPVHAKERHSKARLEIRCLGPLEVSVGGARVRPAAIRRKRVLILLGILLTHHDQPQCKDALIEMLWPGADPDVRTRQFHVLVHELRKLIEPHSRGGNWLYLRNRTDRYVFNTHASCRIDMLEFCALLKLGHKAEAAHEEQAAIGAYEAAAELYQGDYMQDEPFAEWCWQTREQLHEACLGMLNRLSTLWGGQGRWDKGVAWSRRALHLDPLREETHRSLMYALWASGRRDEAVRQYEACAHLLRERLDLTPLPETEQLFARIRATPRPCPGH